MSNSITIQTTGDFSAVVNIYNGQSVTVSTAFSVDGVPVTFPYTLTTTTQFTTEKCAQFSISVAQNGVEVADTPDGRKVIELTGSTTAIFRPSADNPPPPGGGGGGGATDLEGLSDVDLTSPVVGHVLRHDGTQFINVLGTTHFDSAGAASTAQAFAIARANHTGTQAVGTITGLGTAATVNTGTSSGDLPLLSTGGRLPIARVASGTPDGTKFVRDDGTLVAPSGGTVSPLTRAAVQTGNYTAALWDLVPCDSSAGTFTVTLPAASGGKGRIAVKLVAAGNTLNLALTGADKFNTSAGPTTGSLTLPNQGLVLESDGTSIWTITADDVPTTARARVVAEAHADTTIVNTTTETDAVSLTLPAGVVAAGDIVRLTVWADQLNNSGGAVTYTYRLKIGATTALTTSAMSIGSNANRIKGVSIRCDILIESATAQRVRGELLGSARTTDTWPIAASVVVAATGYGVAAEDTTSAKTIKLTVQMGTANSLADFVVHGATLEIVKKA